LCETFVIITCACINNWWTIFIPIISCIVKLKIKSNYFVLLHFYLFLASFVQFLSKGRLLRILYFYYSFWSRLWTDSFRDPHHCSLHVKYAHEVNFFLLAQIITRVLFDVDDYALKINCNSPLITPWCVH
jgi:hypothetical protein